VEQLTYLRNGADKDDQMSPELEDYAELIKAAADPTRLGILILLAQKGEVCVCEMAGELDVPDFKISRHLTILRKSGLVQFRRQGVWMHYSLAEKSGPMNVAMQKLIRQAADQIQIKSGDNDSSCCTPQREPV
jgi:ArsR family transcriptional regulator